MKDSIASHTDLNVMVVESETFDAREITTYLREDAQLTVMTVAELDEAIKQLAIQRIDVIFIGIGQNDSRCPEIVQNICLVYNLPVVLVADYFDTYALNFIESCFSVGYLLKPFTRQHVQMSVQMTLHHHKTGMSVKQGEKMYRSLFRDVPLALFRCNADGKIILMNKKFMQVLGFNTENKRFSLHMKDYFFHPKEWDTFIKVLHHEGVVQQFDASCQQLSGNTIFVRINVHSVSDEAGHLLYYEGSVEDISELKKSTERLVREQHLLNAFIENIPDNIYFKDKQSRFIRVNRSMANWFGLQSPVLAIGLTDFNFFSKEHAQAAFDDEQQVIESGSTLSKEEKETWKDGHITWVWTSKMPLKDAHGNIIGTFGISRNITAQKEAEAKLREQSELMNSLMDNIPDSIFFKDSRGQYILCNKAMADSLNLQDKGDIKGCVDHMFFGKKDAGLFSEEESRLIATGEAVIGKIHQVRQKHSTKNADRWYSTTKVPIKNSEGKITGLVGISRDITEFKRAQEAVHVSEEKFYTVFESSTDAVFLLNQTSIIDCNEATVRMFKVNSKAEVIGVHPAELSPEQQSDGRNSWGSAREKIQEVYNKGTIHFDWIHRRSDLSLFPAEVTLTAFPLGDERVVLAIVHDVTARRAAENAVQLYSDVYKNMEIGIMVYQLENGNDDTALRVVEMNPSAGKIFNRSAKKIIGKKIDDAFPGLREKGIPKICATVVSSKVASELGEIFYEDSRVGTIWFSVRVFPLPNQSVGVSFEDITNRKNLESQLQLSQKLESIGQLAAGIAHEINTPTQYVGDNTRFLKDAFQSLTQSFGAYGKLLNEAHRHDECQSLVAEIEEQIKDADLDYLMEEIPNAIDQSLEGVERVAKIVRAMKDFSHPGSTERNSVDINKTIETTVTVSRNEWKYVADVEMDFDQSLPLVGCYVDEFNQVILNLVTNAAHAIEDANLKLNRHKGKILISTRGTPDGKHVRIQIKDNGAGIPKANRGKIFNPFFTTKEVGKGTGQGLAISHNIIVHKHAGHLTFCSEEGEGTVFTIELPMS